MRITLLEKHKRSKHQNTKQYSRIMPWQNFKCSNRPLWSDPPRGATIVALTCCNGLGSGTQSKGPLNTIFSLVSFQNQFSKISPISNLLRHPSSFVQPNNLVFVKSSDKLLNYFWPNLVKIWLKRAQVVHLYIPQTKRYSHFRKLPDLTTKLNYFCDFNNSITKIYHGIT